MRWKYNFSSNLIKGKLNKKTPLGAISTLPLNKKRIICYPDIVSGIQICFLPVPSSRCFHPAPPWECTLMNNPPLHTISEMVILNRNILGTVMKKWLTESLMHLWLSQCIIFRSIFRWNKPTSIFLIQMDSNVSWLAAMYSAFDKFSEIDICFLL